MTYPARVGGSARTLTFSYGTGDADGRLTSDRPGALVARYTYDGVGRLVRTELPDNGANPVSTVVRFDDYYDGVRRVQEDITVLSWGSPEDAWTERQYVYGPDYVDEFIAQIDAGDTEHPTGHVFYMLQDANYNIVALVNSAGAVVEQYTYEPYGALVAVDDLAPNQHPVNSVGHQGLFYEHLDGGWGLAPGSIGLYYTPGRWYSPALGRWISRDPNETALPVITAMVMNGEAWSIVAGGFDAGGHFGDGMNLYQYAGSNPVGRRDPLGLSDFSWDDEVDDFSADWTGQRLYAVGMINEGARYASIGLKTAMSIAANLLPGYGLYDAFQSVMLIKDGKGGFWDAFNVAIAAFPVLKAAKNVVGLRSLFKVGKYVDRACNSFVGGTIVETPDGPKRIELIEDNDWVLTRPQEEPGIPPIIGRVTGVFRNLAPAVLWLTLSTGQIVGVTPTHEIWTYECGWTLAGELKVGETLTGLDGEPITIVSIVVDRRPTPVYNLEVDGTSTFFAEGVWVHNNRCQLVFNFHHAMPKFLGGLENGRIAMLDEVLHRQYHGGLLTALANAGLHKPRNQKWAQFFDGNAQRLNTALDTLVTYTKGFDGQHGTSLLQHVMNAIK